MLQYASPVNAIRVHWGEKYGLMDTYYIEAILYWTKGKEASYAGSFSITFYMLNSEKCGVSRFR